MHLILIYAGILLGIFLEGEMIMISAVIAAHHGYLNLWLVVVLGVTGTYASDCFYFFLGRKRGRNWINKSRKRKKRAEWIDRKLVKYPVLIYLTYRFMYGFRAITPLVIGTGSTKTGTFILFSSISTIVWAASYCTLGYLFGEVIKSELGHIEHIEKYIILALLLAGTAIIALKRIRKST